MTYFVADIGTTNLKLAVVERGYRVIETLEARNIIDQDENGKHESNPERVLTQLLDLLGQVGPKYPTADRLVFSSQMHALLATDANNQVIQASMTWADLRARDVSRSMVADGTAATYFAISGTPIHAMNPFVKLAYLKEAKPQLFNQQGIRFMDIKAYLIQAITGQFIIDYATGSSMGLMALKEMTWSKQLLQQVGITEAQLPALKASKTTVAVKKDVVESLKLNPNFQIMLGSTDGALANLSNLAYKNDQSFSKPSPFVFSFGTSAAVRYMTKDLVLHEDGSLFTYIVDDEPHYIVGGPLNNAGNVLDWLYQNFGFKENGLSFDEMLSKLMSQPILAEGPYFLPFLNGERAPYWNAFLQAEFKGIQGKTSQMDLAKAVFEGVFFEVKQVIDRVVDTTNQELNLIQVNGKIFKNPDIRQWISNIVGINLQYVSADDASVVGAGVLVEGQGLRDSQEFEITTVQNDIDNTYQHKFEQFKYYAENAHTFSNAILS